MGEGEGIIAFLDVNPKGSRTTPSPYRRSGDCPRADVLALVELFESVFMGKRALLCQRASSYMADLSTDVVQGGMPCVAQQGYVLHSPGSSVHVRAAV